MTMDLTALASEIDRGLIDPAIFHDMEVYRLELERVFGRSWLFMAHDSMIANPGDYITTFMGEDPVIVIRDGASCVRVFLNRCRHRGVQLCPFDRGNARSFSCPYHGWTYSSDGKLINVPDFEAYGGALDPEGLGLIEVPRVESYGGFIFANLDRAAMPLSDYLGDMRFYFDKMFGRVDAGGVEMSPIKQRVVSNHNWKIAADNGSDIYHFGMTHAGSIQTLQDYGEFMPEEGFGDSLYLVTNDKDGAPPHSLLCAKSVVDAHGYDTRMADALDEESRAYIERRHADLAQLDRRIAPGYFAVAGIFPSLLIVDMGPLSAGVVIELWHPKGPNRTETWLYVFVEKNAPPALKKFSAQQMMRFHSFSGSVVPDDHENWERLNAGTAPSFSRRTLLNYTQGLGDFDGTQDFVAGRFTELPGKVGYGMSERGGRALYRYWLKMMLEA